MTLIYDHKRYRVQDHGDFYIRENAQLKVRGVTTVRYEVVPGRWKSYTLNGEKDLLELCGIQGVPGEYHLQVGSQELTLNIGLAHFTPEQVDAMVAFLADQEYRLDVRSDGRELSRTYTALQDDIKAFTEHWQDLWDAVLEVVQRPGRQLTTQLDEVGLQYRQRHDASTLTLNLRSGRLNAQGHPTAESVYALRDQTTLDIAENSHVASVVAAYENRLGTLIDRARRQIRSLQLEMRQEASYNSPESKLRRLQQLVTGMERLQQAMEDLEPLPLPEEWRSFRHKSSTSTNRARFDERYARIIKLEEQLWQNQIHKRPENALDLLQECGRRATWELYEYWLLAQVFAQLGNLGFTCDDPDGFQAFEDWQGAGYGLLENRSVRFTHSSGLQITLTRERHVPWPSEEGVKILKPDIVLNFEDVNGSFPLVLDAKYKNYTPEHGLLARDLQKSARRYGQALGDAMAFLVHPGRKGNPPWQYWPARGPKKAPVVADDTDFPLRHGVVAAIPGGRHDENVSALRRVLTAWFVKHGIYWVCFRCGEDLSRYPQELSKENTRSVAGFRVLSDIGRPNVQKMRNYAYRCPCCSLVAVISFCSNCQQNGVHNVMYKHYPHLETGEDLKRATATSAWVEQMEIMQPVDDRKRYYVRHCAACGSDYIPGERRT